MRVLRTEPFCPVLTVSQKKESPVVTGTHKSDLQKYNVKLGLISLLHNAQVAQEEYNYHTPTVLHFLYHIIILLSCNPAPKHLTIPAGA